jgi:hypothetical protein
VKTIRTTKVALAAALALAATSAFAAFPALGASPDIAPAKDSASPEASPDAAPSRGPRSGGGCEEWVQVDHEEALALAERITDEGVGQVSYNPGVRPPQLILGAPDQSNLLWLRQLRRELGDTFECAAVTVILNDWSTLPAIQNLGAASIKLLTVYLEDAPPFALTGLEPVSQLEDFFTLMNAPPEGTPTLTSVTGFTDVVDIVDGLDFEAWAAKLPNLTRLRLVVQDQTDMGWEPADVTAFAELEAVEIGALPDPLKGEIDWSECSKEVGQLIVDTAAQLPAETMVNGIPAENVTLEALGLADAKTRERIRFEREAEENTDKLRDWLPSGHSDWTEVAAPNPLVGPVVIVGQDNNTSVRAGAWHEDWEGFSSDLLCKTTDTCKYWITIGHRGGAASGRYVPKGGTEVAFEGQLGETIVTIYDPKAKTKAVVVVATTEPPDTVSSKFEAIGEADYDAAWNWVKDNVVISDAT